MQIKINAMKKTLPILLTGVMALLLTSCGTHQNGYDDTDGIYSSDTNTTASTENDQISEKSNYYKQYFQSKQNDYADLPEEDLIFTDIESYSSSDTLDEYGNIVIQEPEYQGGYAGWGDNTTDITVNIYGNAGWGGYWGGYWGWNHWYNPWWYGGWGYSYWSPYWSVGWGWGPYWNAGWYGG